MQAAAASVKQVKIQALMSNDMATRAKRPSLTEHVQLNEFKKAAFDQQHSVTNPTTAADTEEPADLLWAVNAVKLVTNCSDELAMCTVKHNHGKGLNYFQAVTVSCQQISAITSAPTAPIATSAPTPAYKAPQTLSEEVSFIERHLGEGVREMTQAELAVFTVAEKTLAPMLANSTAVPPMSSIVPKNLIRMQLAKLVKSDRIPPFDCREAVRAIGI